MPDDRDPSPYFRNSEGPLDGMRHSRRAVATLWRLFDERPLLILASVLAAQAILWTLVPLLCFENVPLDVAENIGWGREWQWGYYKHPPLQAWLTELALAISGGAHWSIYLTSQLAVVATFIPIFLLGREAAGAKAGLLGVLLFSLVFYANEPTPALNANVLQMPIWAWAALALWRAARERRIGWWLALGVLVALAIYAKYSAVILVASLVAVSFATAEGRAGLKTVGPWVATGTALALITPHLLWLRDSGMLPVEYATARGSEMAGEGRFLGPLQFLLAQALVHLAPALMLLAGGYSIANRSSVGDCVEFRADPGARRFVVSMAIAPCAIAFALALLSGYGLSSMWGAPMVTWISLAAVLAIKPLFRTRRFGAMLACWAAIFAGSAIYAGVAAMCAPAFGAAPLRVAYPGESLTRQVAANWRASTSAPLRIVAGDTWVSGVVAAYSPDRPSVFVDASLRFNPWITAKRIERDGVLVVWSDGAPEPPEPYRSLAPFASRGIVSAPYAHEPGRVARLHWAVRLPGEPLPAARAGR